MRKLGIGFVLLSAWTGIGSFAISAFAAADAEGTPRMNVLFLIADDLSVRLGCYGDEAAITPHIDRLAARGVLFDRAYAAGTVCTPSRKSFLTGLNIRTVGWGNNNFLADNPTTMTLPRWFREHGYQTVKVGKVQHKDIFEGPHCWSLNLNKTERFPGGNAGKVRKKLMSDDGKLVAEVDIRRDDQHSIDEGRTDAFVNFINGRWDRSKPFFFAMGYHAPHGPHEANQRHYDMHPLSRMPLVVTPPNATPMSLPYPKTFQPWSSQVSEQVLREAMQGYYAAVSGLDEQVGRALKFLESEGLANNTIVVLTSDQGYCLGYRDCHSKHIPYPAVLRVPLIIHYPGMPNQGARVQGLVELLDIFPTLTELAALPTPGGLHGVSMVPLIKDPARAGKPAAYAQEILHDGRGTVATTEEGTYIEWKNDNGELSEFYFLSTDPDAWVNRVNDPELRHLVEDHRELLQTHFGQ